MGLENPFTATRYHSLIIEKSTIKSPIEITAWTDLNEIMGIRIKGTRSEGVQFHPESILTEHGKQLIKNFLIQ